MDLKKFSVIFLFLVLTLTGCGDEDRVAGSGSGSGDGLDYRIVGNWQITSAIVGGQPVTPPGWTIILNSDGTGSINLGGSQRVGTWSANGHELSINSEGEMASGVYTLSGNTLSWSFEYQSYGVIEVIAQRQTS